VRPAKMRAPTADRADSVVLIHTALKLSQ